MGLGPAACNKCDIPGSYIVRKGSRWVCPKCLSTNLQGSMGFDWNSDRVKRMEQNLADLYRPQDQYSAKVVKPFSDGTVPDPNDRLRPWLEKNAGKQGQDWDWVLSKDNNDFVDIFFADKEVAVLFELSCT